MAVNVWASETSSTVVGRLREVVVATAGQTVVSLTTFTYTLGINKLSVYINGVRQYSDSYTETSSSSITFSEGLEVGDKVLFEY